MLKESREEKRSRLIKKSEERVSQAFSSSDHPIIQAISAYKELEKIRGMLYERMEEWYGIYFPELKTGNPDTYSDIILSVRTREDATEERLAVLGQEGKALSERIISSGTRPSLGDAEYASLKKMAEAEKELGNTMEKLDGYLKESVSASMPNIAYLIDYKIAAELLWKAGSLERLASFPASTIQLLGAEKALFKHLKFGSKPPKYGVLFKLQQISSAGKKQRGRLARAYATKISIASRADAYSKRFISGKLKEMLDKEVSRIMKQQGGAQEG